MQTIDTIEGNRLIAEFDGWIIEPGMEKEDNPYYNQPYKPGLIPQMVLLSDLKYHTSWDWLMPVVKKWNDLVISKRTGGKAGWMKWQYKTVMLRTEIEPLFKDLVEAIKWYNQNKK